MSNTMSLNMVYTDYLSHHGIMGMKWGKRNGPPYPLAPGAHSASEKKANWEQSLSNKKNRVVGGKNTSNPSNETPSTPARDHYKVLSPEDRNRKIRDLKVKNAVGWAATLLGFPALGITMSLGANMALRDDKNALKKDAQYARDRGQSPIDPKTGLREKQNEMSIEEDVKRVNPLYKDVSDQSKSNCVLCSVTYDLRRRGYDVTAQGAAVGYQNYEVAPWYNNKITYTEIKNAKKDKVSVDDVVNELSSSGGRGIVNVFWPGGGGHAMAYDNEGGTLRIIDAQSGDIYTDSKIKKAFRHGTGAEYARTDNLKINAKEMLKEVCKN